MKENTKDCDKEWEWAYAQCEKLIQAGNNKWREVGKRPPTLQSCARNKGVRYEAFRYHSKLATIKPRNGRGVESLNVLE